MNECMSNCMTALLANRVAKGFELVGKHLNRQKGFNSKIVVFSCVITVYAIMQHMKIDKLSDEVRELKQTRGE